MKWTARQQCTSPGFSLPLLFKYDRAGAKCFCFPLLVSWRELTRRRASTCKFQRIEVTIKSSSITVLSELDAKALLYRRTFLTQSFVVPDHHLAPFNNWIWEKSPGTTLRCNTNTCLFSSGFITTCSGRIIDTRNLNPSWNSLYSSFIEHFSMI